MMSVIALSLPEMIILRKVLSTGCANCKATIALIDQIAQAKGVVVKLEKVEDLRDIMGYGVMSTPGVVNGLSVWWRKLGLNGTNVNQLTSQNLTDLGAGPTFYDCLVQVEKDEF